MTPLHLAVALGKTNVIESLSQGPNFNINCKDFKGSNAAFFVIDTPNQETNLNLLHKYGIDFTAPMDSGSLFTHAVVAENEIHLIYQCIALGISFDIKNKNGMTARDFAKDPTRAPFLEVLIDTESRHKKVSEEADQPLICCAYIHNYLKSFSFFKAQPEKPIPAKLDNTMHYD